MFTITVKRDIKVYACAYKNTVVGKSAKWILRRVLGALQDPNFWCFWSTPGNMLTHVHAKGR